MKTINRQFVDEGIPFGVYVWQMPNGSVVADDQRNFLSIASERGDITKISRLAQAVRAFGINEGKPLFLEGHRKITDEEYQEQTERLRDGKVPDKYDLGALIEDMRNGVSDG